MKRMVRRFVIGVVGLFIILLGMATIFVLAPLLIIAAMLVALAALPFVVWRFIGEMDEMEKAFEGLINSAMKEREATDQP